MLPRPAPPRHVPPDPSPVLVPPGTDGVGGRLGPWRLDAPLGPGVFAATAIADGTPVVVKAAPTADELAAHEALQAVHPALVVAAGTADVDGRTILATHRIAGRPLDQLVADRGGIPFAEAAALLAPVAAAVAAMHAHGWVHGDISAANVVVPLDGAVAVLVDLGAARPVGTPAGSAVEATPASAAPEVRAGATPGPGSDVWSLAAVVVGAVTGEPPTPGSPLPAPMALVLRRALAPDPADRPTAAELAGTLAGVGLGAAPTGPPGSLVEPRPIPRSERVTRDLGFRPATVAPPDRRAVPWGAVVALLAGLVVAALLGWRLGAEPGADPGADPLRPDDRPAGIDR